MPKQNSTTPKATNTAKGRTRPKGRPVKVVDMKGFSQYIAFIVKDGLDSICAHIANEKDPLKQHELLMTFLDGKHSQIGQWLETVKKSRSNLILLY